MDKNNLPRSGIPFPKKIILTISGIFFAVIVFELGLRLGGFIFLSLQEYRNRIAIRKKGTYRIMCLGESVTAGGADSYPFQLEEILNKRNTGIEFTVINKGLYGACTSAIVSRIEDNLNQCNPDMVIAMMGINDSYIKYYEGISDADTQLFQKFKTYKFFRIIWMHIVNRIREVRSYEQEQNKEEVKLQPNFSNDELNRQYPEQISSDQAEEFFNLGKFYRDQGKPSQVENFFKRALELNPQDDVAYVELGRYYKEQGKHTQAEAMFKAAIEINPRNVRAYAGLTLCHSEQGKYDIAEEYSQTANRLRSEYYHPITRSNYQRLKEILTNKGIQLVCVQYPVRSIEPLKKMFEGQEDVIFVDNEGVFKQALKQASYQEYFADMFGGDFGHCTRKGNRLLAENIANVVLKEYFNIRL